MAGTTHSITPDHYRVVDVCVTQGEPEEQIFTTAPLVCIEILSRKDLLTEVQEVVDDYVSIGVRYIWIVNPWKRTAYVGSSHGFDIVADRVFRTGSAYPAVEIPVDELYGL